MNQQSYRKNFVIGVVAIGAVAGVAVGFITAHRVAGEMGEMKGMPMEQMDMKGVAPAAENLWKEWRACQACPQRRPELWQFRRWRDS